MDLIKLKCDNCGATLEVDSDEDKIICQYCKSEVLIDDEAAKIKRIEEAKLKARKENHEQELKEREELHEQELRQQKEKQEAIRKPMNGLVKVIVIACIVFSVLLCATSFHDGKVLAGICAGVMTVLLIWGFLMRVNTIREPKRGLGTIVIIIGIILFLPCTSLYNMKTEKNTNINTSSSSESNKPAEEPKKEESKPAETTSTSSTGLGKEFKEAMDSYEAFVDEYCAFMKKYSKSNGTDMSLLADYAKYVSKLSDMSSKFEKWNSENLNSTEQKYYLEVQTRASKKMLEASTSN